MRFLKNLGAWIKRHTSRASATAAALAVTAVAASAQEASNPIDLSAASSAVDNLTSAVTGFFTGDLLDALLVIIGAGVVIWVVFLAWKFIKKGGKQAS